MKLLSLTLKDAKAFRKRSMTLYRIAALLGGLVTLLLTLGSTSMQSSGALASSLALRTIELQPNGNGAKSITSSMVTEIARLSRVQSIYTVISSQAATKTPTVGFVMYPTNQVPMLEPPIIRSIHKNVFPLGNREIVLPSFAPGVPESSVLALVGSTIPVSITRQVTPGVGILVTKPMRVVGVYNGNWQLAGHEAAFVNRSTALQWAALSSAIPIQKLLATRGYNAVYVVARNPADVNVLLGDLGQRGLYATSFAEAQSNEPGVLKLANLLGKVLAVVLAIVIFAATAALMGTQLRGRTRELSTLRALGYRASELSGMLIGEFAIRGLECAVLATISGVIATVFGNIIVRYLDLSVRPSLPSIAVPSLETLLVVGGLIMAAIVFGGLLPLRTNLTLEPTEGLRDL